MDNDAVLAALAALAHDTRLEVFRLLVSAAPAGLAVCEIGARLGVRQNTMSTNLAILARAGLVTGRREGRIVRYRAELAAMRALLAYLMHDCCGGRPEICRPLRGLVA